MFQYRFGPIDADYPEYCNEADSSISGLNVYSGDKLPEKYKNMLFAVDYSKKCA